MKHYLDYTRSPWGSYVLVLPLLVLYQVTALVVNLGHRQRVINGADALLQMFLNAAGLHGWLGSWIAITAIVGAILYRVDAAHRKAPVRTDLLPLLLSECTVYALVFGALVSFITRLILPGMGFLRMGGGLDFGQNLAASLGAGLYEELVFRVVLTGGAIWLLRRFGWSPGLSAAAAVLASSAIFSGFHYIGPFRDHWGLASFTFRMVAGAVLAGLFATRGFAVAAWTHALYDVFLLLAGH